MKYLALTLPGGQNISGAGNVPQGGISGAGGSIVRTGIQLLLGAAIILALFYVIYGGIKWMTSGGDQEKLAGARQTIIFAVIGLAIAALSFTIITVLGQLANTNFLSVPNTNNFQ